jgi:uncharacterized protein (TIGR02271 family)
MSSMLTSEPFHLARVPSSTGVVHALRADKAVDRTSSPRGQAGAFIMDQTVIGDFGSEGQARDAEYQLRSAGFTDVDLHSKESITTSEASYGEGSIVGFFRRLFGSETHPDLSEYSTSLESGRWIVVAHADSDDEADRIRVIMESCGASGFEGDERSQARRAQASHTDKLQSSSSQRSAKATEKIPVVEEQLQVGKRVVERGGVRIYMRTSERPVEEKVNLREQRVLVERRPVDRPATGADLSDQDRVLEVRTIAEEPVVAKSARVVEEVEIGRDSSEHTETIRDTVRRKDVEVENLDEGDIQQPVPGSGPRERRPRP